MLNWHEKRSCVLLATTLTSIVNILGHIACLDLDTQTKMK